MELSLKVIPEPELEFAHRQRAEYPKDGLFLYGPTDDENNPRIMRVGVIGTSDGVDFFGRWAKQIQGYIRAHDPEKAHHSAFPGFQTTFGTDWPLNPTATIVVSKKDIDRTTRIKNAYERVREVVRIFSDEIERFIVEEDSQPEFWFVVIPEDVYRFGRKESVVPFAERIEGDQKMSARTAGDFLRNPALFDEMMEEASLYQYENNFHNQLKAVLLGKAVVQVVRETTLAPDAFLNEQGYPIRHVQDPATIAWNLCTTAFFKAQGKPWKIAEVRQGVCYVGIVFKKVEIDSSDGNACCGAQLFLNSGDGLVFKGAVGPWYSSTTKEYHLKNGKAKELMDLVVRSYEQSHGVPPREVFIHGRARFSEEEWKEFSSAVPNGTKIVGIRIQSDNDLKLYRLGKHPPLRGTFYKAHHRLGYLWTRGFIPRLATYPGWEVPNPLRISIDWGEGDLDQVVSDIMALTKVNFNSCIFGDGLPVTLRFADAVGEILTAAPDLPQAPLPFRFYI